MMDSDGSSSGSGGVYERGERGERFWWDSYGWEMTFVENMRMLRERRGMSQTELARKMGGHGHSFHQPTVQRIESGQRPLKLTEALSVADILGSDLHTMMNDVSLPFAHKMLVDELATDRLTYAIRAAFESKMLTSHATQIREHLEDYLLAAERFKAEPVEATVTAAKAVIERLEWLVEMQTTCANSASDILVEIEELTAGLAIQAHGGTPWDDDESERDSDG